MIQRMIATGHCYWCATEVLDICLRLVGDLKVVVIMLYELIIESALILTMKSKS